MLTFVIVLQVVVAVLLVLMVLLQPGNKGGVSAAFGGSGGDTVFGGRGANTFLTNLTFMAAVLFMLTNFALSYMSSSQGSVLDRAFVDTPAVESVQTSKSDESKVKSPAKKPESDGL
ncbi:preprotein translocase subunit SecG [Sulfobacillus acidophilus]|uniref:Protein-export membrane protein SecG n=1 Tax=Sulfobacillus acidophilus TaxID=53633 RepID=A0ABS3AVE8_9FIRM|nr:preprotein translocase subunit SecG [Sulfobacillus acidophilus]